MFEDHVPTFSISPLVPGGERERKKKERGM
jgi:hypothetical protein